jgi:large subunit ribosomal protein L21
MYAIIEFKGKQYKAEKGKLLKVDLVNQDAGSAITIDKVLLLSDKETQTVSVGAPYVAGAKVKATIQEHIKDKKVIVFKYIPKKDYRRKNGHRQQYSMLKVDDILTA